MKTLQYSIAIHAPKRKVWETMLAPESYKAWVNVSWPGSYYESEWEQGANFAFVSPGQGGTVATITELRPYDIVVAEHIAVLHKDGVEDWDSDTAKGWIGSTESYIFTEIGGATEFNVEINTLPEWG
ncbi:MAG: SRPBCC domain-containing protein [Chloroflexia bacterium]